MVINNEYVKADEAAKIMGFSVQHTRFLIRQGYLKGTKIGRDWIIALDVLKDFIARRNMAPMFPDQRKGRPPKTIPGNGERTSTVKEKPK